MTYIDSRQQRFFDGDQQFRWKLADMVSQFGAVKCGDLVANGGTIAR